MIQITRRYIFLLAFVLGALTGNAQETRTLATRIADTFALLPANDSRIAEVLFLDLIQLGDEGLAMLTNGVRPAGEAQGLPHRYAIALLTHYAVSPVDKAKVEVAYLAALAKATNPDVKIYFIENLALVGSDKSVAPLTLTLQDPALAATAIGALEAIGSKQASDALRASLSSAPSETQRIVKALGRLRDANSVEAITKLVKTDKPKSTDKKVDRSLEKSKKPIIPSLALKSQTKMVEEDPEENKPTRKAIPPVKIPERHAFQTAST